MTDHGFDSIESNVQPTENGIQPIANGVQSADGNQPEENHFPSQVVDVPSGIEAAYETTPVVEDNKVTEKETSKEEVVDMTNAINSYTCPRCKAVFSTNNSALSGYCIYCDTRAPQNIGGKVYPDSFVLPFVKTVAHAKSEFKHRTRWNPFIPFSFRGNKLFRRMRKLYLVCTLCDFEVTGNITFLCSDRVTNVKGAPSQGFESMYSTSFQYDNILTSNFAKLDDSLISAINNYNYNVLQPFTGVTDAVLLTGDMERDDIVAHIQDKISKHAIGTVRSNVNHTLKKVGENKLAIRPASVRTVLVPVYYLNLPFNGKNHFFLMNGQTGETVFEVPMSGLSIAVFSIVTWLVIFALTALVMYLI